MIRVLVLLDAIFWGIFNIKLKRTGDLADIQRMLILDGAGCQVANYHMARSFNIITFKGQQMTPEQQLVLPKDNRIIQEARKPITVVVGPIEITVTRQ